MFNFIKRLFSQKSTSKTKRVKVAEVRVVTNELLLGSLIGLFIDYLAGQKFAKQYQCIIKFVNQIPTPKHVDDPLSFDELIELGESSYKTMQEVGLLKLAKQYTMLRCKCPGNTAFDLWMERLSSIVVE